MVLFEALEKREMFSGTPIPTGIAAAYAAITADNATLKADMKSAVAALTAELKIVAKDVKALGKSTANAKLLAQITSDAAKLKSAWSGGVTKFLAVSGPVFKGEELAEAAFTAKPNLANGHKLAAATNKANALKNVSTDPRFTTFDTKGEDAFLDLETKLGNPTASTLNADVSTMDTTVQTNGGTLADDRDAVVAAIPALEGILNG